MVGKITAGAVSVRGNSALHTDRGDCTLALIKIVEENKQSTQELHWYALRVFRNRINGIKAQIETSGRETYRPMKVVDAVEGGALHYKEVALIPALLFLKSDLTYVKELRYKNFGQLMVYTGAATTEPAAIPDNQMEAFMKATSAYGNKDVEVLEDEKGMELFRAGQPVRVINGIYKGATGVVKRIRKDRKLLVAIEGVAVIAISRIPLEFLEKI